MDRGRLRCTKGDRHVSIRFQLSRYDSYYSRTSKEKRLSTCSSYDYWISFIRLVSPRVRCYTLCCGRVCILIPKLLNHGDHPPSKFAFSAQRRDFPALHWR